MQNLVCFENTFFEKFAKGEDNGAFACISIDGYPADEDASGEVVARVWITRHGDIIVDWHNNGYRLNNQVLELIAESKEILKQEFEGE